MHNRVAVLIDGGFYRKRYREIYREIPADPKELAKKLYGMAMAHAGNMDNLYRIFYYDCPPLSKKSTQSGNRESYRLFKRTPGNFHEPIS